MKRTNYDDLFTKEDFYTSYDGGRIFFEDKNLEIPYNGVVIDYFKDVLNWEFEVKNGFIEGIEKVYYEETGELMEQNEIKRNYKDGLVKEFYKSGNLKSICIVIKNIFIYEVSYDEFGNITDKKYSLSQDQLNSPIYDDIRDKIDIYMEKYKDIKELDLQ